jgi:hypothetical protein
MAFEDIQGADNTLQQQDQLSLEDQAQQNESQIQNDGSLPALDIQQAEQQDPPSKGQKLYRNLLNIKNQDGTPKYNKDILGDENEFLAAISDNAKADKIYSKLQEGGLGEDQIGSKKEFLDTFSKKKISGKDLESTAQVPYQLESGSPSTSVSPDGKPQGLPVPQQDIASDDYFGLAKKAKQLKEEATSYETTTTPYGTSSVQKIDATKAAQVDAINKQIKDAGYDPDKLLKDVDGINDKFFQVPEFSSQQLAKDYKDNPQLYQRKIASAKWQSGLYNTLRGTTNAPEYNKALEYVHNATNPALDYDTRRGNVQAIANIVNNYAGDNKKELLDNLYTDFSNVYASAKINPNDPLLSKLNENQIIAYNAVQDLQPTEALKYKAALLDDNDIANNEDAKLTKEIAQKRLEEMGIAMKRGWVLENGNKYQKEYQYLLNKYENSQTGSQDVESQYNENQDKLKELGDKATELKSQIDQSLGKYKEQYIQEYNGVINEANTLYQKNEQLKQSQGALTSEELNRLTQLEAIMKPYKDLYASLDEQTQALSNKYKNATHLDARDFAQELIGQETSGFSNLMGKAGIGIYNTAKGLINMVTTPFYTDQENEIRQAALLGEQRELESLLYQTQDKGYSKQFEPKLSPELKTEIDKIKADKSLDYNGKLQKTWMLLADRPLEYQRAPVTGDKTNISGTSLLYGIGNMAAGLVPFILAEYATGGEATAGYASKFLRTFTAAAVTSFNDEYAAAIQRGSKNPYSDAMMSTAINSAAMAGAGAPDAIRNMLGNKTAIGKLVGKMTDDEILDALRTEPKQLSLLRKSFNIGKNVGEVAVSGVKQAVQFVAATTTGKVVNDAMLNDLKHPSEYVNDAMLGLMDMSVFNVALGTLGKTIKEGGITNITDVTKDAIHLAAKNPVQFLGIVDQKLKDGTYSPEKAKEITNNIMNANRVLQSTPMLDANGNELNQDAQRNLLFLKMQKNDAEAMLTKDISKDLASKIGDRLTNIDDKIDKIYKGTLLETVAPTGKVKKLTTEGNAFINEGIESGKIPAEEAANLTNRKSKIEFLSNVASQARGENLPEGTTPKDIRTKYGDAIVDHALEQNPVETKEVKPISDTEITTTFGKASAYIPQQDLEAAQTTINKVNNAENINEEELKKTEDILYTALDKHPEAAHLIEPLITKLQDHEFTTKTETVQTTEKVPVEGAFAAKSKELTKPALEHSEGSESTITLADGTTHTGKLAIRDGKYVIESEGKEPVVIGEKAITDRDLKLPSQERVPEPIEFDKDGNVSAVSFETRDGHIVKIQDPEKALDIAIKLHADAVGEVPDAAFEKVYQDVVRENKIEVPVEKPKVEKKQKEQKRKLPKKPPRKLPRKELKHQKN